MSWEDFGNSGKKNRWYQSINMLPFKNLANQAVELRIVTADPFWYAVHWRYKFVEDAWMHRNDKDALKAKYPDQRKIIQYSFECPNVDHMTGRSSMESCPCCTTYADYQGWPSRTALVQAFYRVPKSKDKALQQWSKDLYVIQLNKSMVKSIGRIINTQGQLHSPKDGYTVFVTYTPNGGPDSWTVDYGRPTPLTREQYDLAKVNRIDFNEVYEPGDIAELERELSRSNYPMLLDGSLDETGGVVQVGGRRAPAASRVPAAGRSAAPVRGKAPPVSDDGADDIEFTDEAVDEFPEEDFGGDYVAESADEPEIVADDYSDLEDEVPPARRTIPAGRQAPPVRQVAPPVRTATPVRPVSRPVAPVVRPAAPPARPTRPTR